MTSSPRPFRPKGKMKNDCNKWSSVNEVVDSFNNLSLMPTVKSQESDIFTQLSPPKHCISPSQIELLKSMGCGVDLTSSPRHISPISMGRGGILKKFTEHNLNLKARDKALQNDIRATNISTYSNASIENFFNNCCHPNSNEQMAGDNCSSEGSFSHPFVKSTVEVASNSSLRVEADEFYPSSVVSDPVELSKSQIPSESSNYLAKETLPQPHSTRSSPTKANHNDRRSRTMTNGPNYPVKNDSHIGFSSKCFDSDDEVSACDNGNNSFTRENMNSLNTFSTPSVSSISVPRLKELPNRNTSHKTEPKVVEQMKPVKAASKFKENGTSTKQHCSKRIMKNALLSSLSSKHTEESHLMKPVDFKPGTVSSPSLNSSTFQPISPANPGSSNTNNAYDLKLDSSLDPNTKHLTKKLISNSSELFMASTTSNISGIVTSSSTQLKKRKPLSQYDYKYNDQDFPPLC